MKFKFASSGDSSRSQRGVALITVLLLVVLITSVIVGFLITSRLEQKAAVSYKASAGARLMADTVVNLVQSQINEGTSQGINFAWASQPGAIRVFDNQTGQLSKIYRLYSAQKLNTTSAEDMNTSTTPAGSNDMPPSTWATSPSVWVDLNASANDGAGNVHYPIFDAGRAANVDGFSVDMSNAVSGTTATQVPMPVIWLYVLQNGAIIAPDAGGATTATFANATVHPSASNPIVGRIAYWTDDESCKVNINTAGGDGIGTATDPTNIANATFWDTPHFSAPDDVSLANFQPVSGEFQRYPGHPATVALHNILNGLGWSLNSSDFYSLLPRYSLGGSQGGTVGVAAAATTGAIPLKTSPQNRLYSSVSEMLFNYDRTKSVLNADDASTRQKIETAGFFLTAHSRAPEVTLSGQPRISIWPVMDSTAIHGARTPIDKLLAFSATNSNHSYYFTRSDPTSSSVDIGLPRNQVLLNYLDHFTSQAIPGYPGVFSQKYGAFGTRQILTEIFDYIRSINIADSTQPLSGGNNVTEYSEAWAIGPVGYATQTLYGLFQVAPSVVNSSTAPLLNGSWGTQGFGIFPRLNEAALQFVALGRGASPGVPAISLNASYTSSPLLSAGDTGTDPNNAGNTTNQFTLLSGAKVPPGNTAANSTSTMAVQAFLLLSFTNPSQMIVGDGTVNNGHIIPAVWVEVSWLNSSSAPLHPPFSLYTADPSVPTNVHSLGFTTDDSMIIGANQGTTIGGSWDSVLFAGMISLTRTAEPGANHGADPLAAYPFYSKIIPITFKPDGTGRMNFIGGTITVKIYDGKSGSTLPNASHLIQTYTITFPNNPVTIGSPTTSSDNGFPIPTVTTTAGSPTVGPTVGVHTASDRWFATGTFGNPNTLFIVPGDVVQSMVLSPQWADARVLAVNNVPAAAFTTEPQWGTQPFAYGFMYDESPYYSSLSLYPTPGILNPNANYIDSSYATHTTGQPYYVPAVPPTLGAHGVNTGGFSDSIHADWDNGMAWYPDGPWINKADEGNLIPPAAPQGHPWIPYFTQGEGLAQTGSSFFSPNREVPSPGMFGSLSTGIDPSNPKPWQTLLFRPCPGHEGEANPKDHLMLDLFWMPVAEPYAISEPFSSAGKVNLNYQIEPFTYINRSTALRAVLNAEKIAQIPATNGRTYKFNTYNSGSPTSGSMTTNARVALDPTETLKQFDDKFNGTNISGQNSITTPDIFHSASQICEMYLVPQGSAVATFAAAWNDGSTYGLVGDNVRERPYTNIYGQVTTKSNTFTVHYTVQSLKNAEPAALQNQWSESHGVVLGEYRGSATLERYVDPNQALPDFAGTPGAQTLESYYKWRVAESHQFAP